ncbi:MAG: hypothetical protein J6V67_06635, partial [Campylobacter sp.]|nr:hypothetical protein [Campylobacter sp.]
MKSTLLSSFSFLNIFLKKKEYQRAFDLAITLNNLGDQNLSLLELCAKSALAVNQLDVAESYVG